MSRFRFRLGVALTASAVLLPLAGQAGAAQAAVVAPTVASVTTLPGHPETLVAEVSSDSALTSVTAQLWGYGLDGAWKTWKVALSRDASSGSWRSDPVVVKLGSYQAKVTAIDADGDAGVSGLTTLEYLIQPSVDDLTLSPARVDFDHPDVVVTGKMRFYDPRTQETAAAANGTAFLTVYEPSIGNGSSAEVQSDGTFRLTGRPSEYLNGDDLRVEALWLPADNTTARINRGLGDSTLIDTTVPSAASAGRIVLDRTTYVDNHPALAAVTGVVQRRVGDTWVGVPGVKLRGVADEDTYPYDNDAVTTGTGGRFRVPIPIDTDGGAEVSIWWSDPLRAFLRNSATSGTARAHIVVHPRTTIVLEERQVSPPYILLTGRVDSSSYAERVVRQRLYLVESRDGRTDWNLLGSFLTDGYGRFYGVGRRVGHASWYHRLVYKGNGNLQRSVSRNFRTGFRDTRIVGFKVSSSSVRRGGSVTLTGRVQVDNGTTSTRWAAPGRRLPLDLGLFTLDGLGEISAGTGHTGTSGLFRITVHPRWGGRWIVRSGWTEGVHLMPSHSTKLLVKIR